MPNPLPSTRLRKWFGRAVAASLVLLALAEAAFAWESRTGDLFNRLAHDARVAYAPRHRAMHVDSPLPGSFGQLYAQAIPDLLEAWDTEASFPQDVSKKCEAVGAGELPFPQVPDECRANLMAHLRALHAALAATHAEGIDTPPSMNALRADAWEKNSTFMLPVAPVLHLAKLDMRRVLDAGDIDGALVECVDGLAFGRDISYAPGVIGMASGMGAVATFATPCRAALKTASPEKRAAAAKQILRIRDAWNPYENVLMDESVWGQLGVAHAILSQDWLNELPMDARALTLASPVRMEEWSRAFAPLLWRNSNVKADELRRVLLLPEKERVAAFAAAARPHESGIASLFNFVLGGFPTDQGPFYARYLATRATLTELAGE